MAVAKNPTLKLDCESGTRTERRSEHGIVPPSKKMVNILLCAIYRKSITRLRHFCSCNLDQEDPKMALNIFPSKNASLVYGPTTEPLWNITLGALIEKQAARYGERTAVVFPRQNIRRTYRDLFVRSRLVSKALIEQGLEAGDCVGIFAGNCCEYVETFLGAGAIGCPVVVLNAGYTPTELRDAIIYSGKSHRCASSQ